MHYPRLVHMIYSFVYFLLFLPFLLFLFLFLSSLLKYFLFPTIPNSHQFSHPILFVHPKSAVSAVAVYTAELRKEDTIMFHANFLAPITQMSLRRQLLALAASVSPREISSGGMGLIFLFSLPLAHIYANMHTQIYTFIPDHTGWA